MKNTRISIAVLVAASLSLWVVAAQAQKVTIDFKFNTLTGDSSNYFNWVADGKVVKDGYDAKTGASKAGSTALFDTVRYDSADTKNAAIPVGLRSLVLFPLAGYDTAKNDALSVAENKRQLTIRFVHRGNAYQVKTDDKGRIDLDNAFSMAPGVADNIGGKFLIKAEYLKEGGNSANMADLDWSKITLVPDTVAEDALKSYSGTLNTTFKKGILTIKGNLTKK